MKFKIFQTCLIAIMLFVGSSDVFGQAKIRTQEQLNNSKQLNATKGAKSVNGKAASTKQTATISKTEDGKLVYKSTLHSYEIFSGTPSKSRPSATIHLYDNQRNKIAELHFMQSSGELKSPFIDEKLKKIVVFFSMDMFDHFKDILENGKTLSIQYDPREKMASVVTDPKQGSARRTTSSSKASKGNLNMPERRADSKTKSGR